MIRSKPFPIALLLLIAGGLAGGCASMHPANGPDSVSVNVYPDGQLTSGNDIPIPDADLATFAKEVGDKSVRLVPNSNGKGMPSLSTMEAAKQKLRSAGIGRVGIEGISS